MIHGDSTAASINNAANSAPWGDTQRRVLSMFVRNQRTDVPVRLTVLLNVYAGGAERQIKVVGTNALAAGAFVDADFCIYWGLDEDINDGAWHRVEIDLNAVRDTVRPGIPIMSVNGLIVEGADVLVDDLTLAAGRLRRAYQLVPGAALGGTLAVQAGADGGEGLTAVNARAYYQYNDLGTVLATTDANGARVGLWRPTFFGEYDDTIDYAQGPTAAAGSPTWPEIGLTGKIWDEDTKLYYFNARWYDPHRGRWMSTSPLSKLKEYENVFSNDCPARFADVNGLISGEGMAIGGFLGGFAGFAGGALGGMAAIFYCPKLDPACFCGAIASAVVGGTAGGAVAGAITGGIATGDGLTMAGVWVAVGSGSAGAVTSVFSGYYAGSAAASLCDNYFDSECDKEYRYSRCHQECKAGSTTGFAYSNCMKGCNK